MINARLERVRSQLVIFIYFIFSLLCFNLSHAQLPTAPPSSAPSAAPTNTGLPTTSPPSPPTGSSSVPAALNAVTNSVQPTAPTAPGVNALPQAVPTAGKYAEFQSVCRTKDYESPAYYSDELKNLRLATIKDRMKINPESISLHLRLLQELIDQRKTELIQKTEQEIKTKSLTQSDRFMLDASMALMKGDKKTARESLNKILTENPKNIDALKMLAEVYAKDSNYFETTTIYLDLAKITGKDFYEELCEAYTLDSHYNEAESYCYKGVASGKSPYSYIFLGVGAREQQKLKLAKNYFLKSIKIKETEMGYVCLGEIQVSEKKISDAIVSLKQAVAKFPKSDRAHLALAWAYFTDKQRLPALDHFQKACSLNRKIVVEVRKTLKILLDEKSADVPKYSTLLQACESL